MNSPLVNWFPAKLSIRTRILLVAGAAAILAGSLGADGPKQDSQLLADAQGQFKPLPKNTATAEHPATPERVALGRQLFFDPRISVDGTVSCSRCHQAALYATDGLPTSRGAHDNLLPRNAPATLNTGLYIAEHWDGVFKTVEEQATRALLGAGFANPDYATAMQRVQGIPGYAAMFAAAFPAEKEPVTQENWGQAIGAYERTLMTPGRFDEYLAGKSDALTATEQQGLRIFIDVGCAGCHNGAGVGGGQFAKFGVVENYWPKTHSRVIDKGRIDVTKNAEDLYVFKVPSLRNVAMTPPYFHDGSVAELVDAVRIMGRVQLDSDLSDQDMAAIVAFLKSLTGKLPEDFVHAPELPPAGFRGDPK